MAACSVSRRVARINFHANPDSASPVAKLLATLRTLGSVDEGRTLGPENCGAIENPICHPEWQGSYKKNAAIVRPGLDLVNGTHVLQRGDVLAAAINSG